MAENDTSDRTERATPKRLEDARRRGQLPRSPELGAAVVTMATATALLMLGSGIIGRMAEMMRRGLSLGGAPLSNENAAIAVFQGQMLDALLSVAPVLGLVLVAALLAPMALGGWNFSTEALGLKLERISPAKGFSRMFSVRSLVELAKSISKFLAVGLIAVLVLWTQIEDILQLSRQAVVPAMAQSLRLTAQALLAMAGALALIAVIDVPYQIWQHGRQLRMTRQEVRQEHRESEGAPEVKGRIRQTQQALARRRMMAEVPNATVVVTNPTHYAVALRYDERRDGAPVLVAKGADEVAARIREIAAANAVPLVSAPPLARVLFRNVDLGVPIPAALYVAVAQILTYVMHLKTATAAGAQPPPPPTIDPAVEELGRNGRPRV
ncbi:MAG: flagellar biosynthesis protein FlhB [Sinobacteraceae bacterium]|nr:flagellar biosynthesis protein FlhB [Nevskiaceae bacterium]MCP5339095.1 flagellar biosynthesis protein FlhB [Nevskiaceae bacterium]MCP5360004.1 flagellar biosynthesis protein FlhB [Nevskiaceae bacterium]MCP5466934.1 flagellar biosynthesis protein FlhB [Nevskiaceae bacterium]MCP5472176.1 flagellar biosynthesis protein FlhB [Nevskiaceae bacterium]